MNPNQKKHNQNEMKINQGGQGAIDLYLRVPPQDPRWLARNAKKAHNKSRVDCLAPLLHPQDRIRCLVSAARLPQSEEEAEEEEEQW